MMRALSGPVALVCAALLVNGTFAQSGPVIPSGAMRDAMHGQFQGVIDTDTLTMPGTYGLGPMEFLRGELLVLDGHVFRSTATGSNTMQVAEHPGTKAPFFVHQRVVEWSEVTLPPEVNDLATLDMFLTGRYGPEERVFAFRMTGVFDTVAVHVLDVPEGTRVHSRDEAHRFDKHYRRAPLDGEVLGFFSTRHKGVFTHHDAHIHVHAISAGRDWMGHVEAMRFNASMVKLYIATNW